MTAEIVEELFAYASSFDGTAPLYAFAARPAGEGLRPLVIVMHGYSGSHKHVVDDCQRMAARGVVAVAPDMRGGGESAGRFDSGGLEIMDILDCVTASLQRYAGGVDPGNVNIWGFSGGGANALFAAMRFPDAFSTVTAFFPITDFAFWYRDSEAFRERIHAAVGGSPEEAPERYAARNIIPAARNNARSQVRIYWDSEETVCGARMDWDFVSAAHAAGRYNVVPCVSAPGDALRWHHGYPDDWPQMETVETDLFPAILSGGRDVSLPDRGFLVVPGFVVTRRFSVFIGDGGSGVVGVEYDLAHGPSFELRPVGGRVPDGVRIELRGRPM